jgi:NADPH-dependent 2,4-dienoyl-CoA reductase/sulfur reductase-like enzyme/peroxiredoxin family protein/rhodanese-related sulfurtransferase/TusA-related sulfurtransferase
MAKYLIIGGVAGGATAAARLRRNDEDAEIILIERGDYISYANCGLPYYTGGVIADRAKLFVMTPEKFRETLNIDVRIGTEAVAIDRAARKVVLVEKATGRRYEEGYDHLVLSPGAEPARPPIPGLDLPGVFTLRSVPDADAIKEWADLHRPRRAIVVGAGFIGLEMAENLAHRGAEVAIVEALNQVMAPLDFEMAALVHQHLRDKGVELRLEDGVKSFEKKGSMIAARLSSGSELLADIVVFSVGVRPDTALAREAGLELVPQGRPGAGAIIVDERLRTSDPRICALGDAVAFRNAVTGEVGITALAGPANKQARILADSLVFGDGKGRAWKGALGTSVAKVFDLTVASTGASEKALKRLGRPAASVIVHPSSHASYYPGAFPLALKLVYDPADGKALGAQAVGVEGADKRIDAIAAMIGMGATIDDLAEFEQAYAPPFSSAKDPVNLAAFAAENAMAGRASFIAWDEFEAERAKGAFVLDVRTREEFELGAVPGAVCIPNTELRGRLGEVPRDRPVLLYCGVGLRGYLSERILRQRGWTDVRNLSGGYRTWRAATEPQDNPGSLGSRQARAPEIVYGEGSGAPEGAVAGAGKIIHVDACGLQCPGPIMRLKAEIDKAEAGTRVLVSATDPGFARDAEAWCRLTGNTMASLSREGGRIEALIEKGRPLGDTARAANAGAHGASAEGATFIVFSSELDKALASFVLASGAASVGKKVTMFFTFWGLSVILKKKKPRVRKDLMGRMFGAMLPSHSGKLKLSSMNFAGIGPAMMRGRMAAKGVDSLEAMMEAALKAGVRFVACQMSMDVMGVKAEELMDGVEIGGVATYMGAAEEAGVNLFI